MASNVNAYICTYNLVHHKNFISFPYENIIECTCVLDSLVLTCVVTCVWMNVSLKMSSNECCHFIYVFPLINLYIHLYVCMYMQYVASNVKGNFIMCLIVPIKLSVLLID